MGRATSVVVSMPGWEVYRRVSDMTLLDLINTSRIRSCIRNVIRRSLSAAARVVIVGTSGKGGHRGMTDTPVVVR